MKFYTLIALLGLTQAIQLDQMIVMMDPDASADAEADAAANKAPAPGGNPSPEAAPASDAPPQDGGSGKVEHEDKRTEAQKTRDHVLKIASDANEVINNNESQIAAVNAKFVKPANPDEKVSAAAEAGKKEAEKDKAEADAKAKAAAPTTSADEQFTANLKDDHVAKKPIIQTTDA